MLVLQKASSWTSDRVLNTPVRCTFGVGFLKKAILKAAGDSH